VGETDTELTRLAREAGFVEVEFYQRAGNPLGLAYIPFVLVGLRMIRERTDSPAFRPTKPLSVSLLGVRRCAPAGS
jgi:hypothetical protein